MAKLLNSISFVVLAFVFAACTKAASKPAVAPDIDPEASSQELALQVRALKAKQAKKSTADKTEDERQLDLALSGPLDAVLKMGERNLAWLKHINSKLPADKVLSFSNKSTMSGYPMDKPSVYSDTLTIQKFNQAKIDMPEEMFKVIFEGQPFTDTPPIDSQKYLEWGLKLDKIYQTAARWLTMQPYLPYLKSRRQEDIRGYYFLSIEPDLENKLNNFKSLPAADHDRLQQWLVLICFNTDANQASCEGKLKTAEANGTVLAHFQQYNPAAKAMFEDFFKIDDLRTDLNWNSSAADVLTFPFKDTNNVTVNDYLKTNIEDEWKWGTWKLVIDFLPDALTHVVFQAGSTPHVNGLAGSEITMDANAPLTEWDVQWTIRHEFGHTLGFKDCYIEFYDEQKKEMFNYQIDVTNLMCSRQGRLQEQHFNELKRVYFHQ